MFRLTRPLSIAVTLAIATPVFAETQDSSSGNAERGARVFAKCKACHQIGDGAKNGVGPHLTGILGRGAGSVEEYRYSPAMAQKRESGLVWDAQSLSEFLENPLSWVPGTWMLFAGVKEPQDRRDLLAYLAQYSGIPAGQNALVEVSLPPEVLSIVGDAAHGEYLAADCLSCHSLDGTAAGMPNITNWPTEDFVHAMHAYKRAVRTDPIMQMMAARLSDEEIAALAAYFAGIGAQD